VPYGPEPYGRSNPESADRPDPLSAPAPDDPLRELRAESDDPLRKLRELARKRRGTVLAGVLVVALVLVGLLGYRWGTATAPQALPPARATPTPSATPPTAAQVYASVAPSVVSVLAQHPDGSASGGTGVIVNADATILTALHVVNGASSVRVVFADGTQSTATVTGTDPTMDIAQLAPTDLPEVVVPAVLGSAGRLAVGDSVIAIGDQLGLTRTATAGVVSGLNRQAPGQDGTTLTGLIQFDAAVNHGSSGGPLVDGEGQTVGIVVALVNPTAEGTFIGIGFAVPIETAVTAGGGQPIRK
jgi:S1-C subfamily serine protease